MKRRIFLKKTLTGLPLILATPTLLAACDKDEQVVEPNGKTVIVVGAGISGLAAARKLANQGFIVIVLEAQEKVGGRLRTDRTLDVPFDEGASWIHGPNGNPITDLANQAGADRSITSDDSLKVFDIDGTEYSNATLTIQEDEFEGALDDVTDAGNHTEDFESIFNTIYPSQATDRLWKYMLSAYLEFSIGGDISQLSSLYFYDDEEFSGADEIITNGYDRITDHLALGLDIRLNNRVSIIDYSTEKVKVTANGTLLECDHLIVTVPLGVLKSNDIVFAPNLPSTKTTAIEQTGMGNINKFLLTWDTPFWDTNLQYVGFTPEQKGKFNYFMNLNTFSPSSNALMTFAFGNYASVTESLTDQEVIDEIMSHLQSIYGMGIPAPTNMLRTKWGGNINSYGAYSFAKKGATSDSFDTLASTINNRLFFGGEHTHRDYRGTVHGAYLSGLREADKIIDLY